MRGSTSTTRRAGCARRSTAVSLPAARSARSPPVGERVSPSTHELQSAPRPGAAVGRHDRTDGERHPHGQICEQRMPPMTLVERFGLDGKAALVVGGGYGIGRETSLLLAEAGARVAVADIDPERAASGAEEVNGVPNVGDVTDPDGPLQVVDTAHAQLGGLDRVANIVGIATFVEDVF